MDQEQALRDRLAAIAAPPSGVSIDSVLPAARRGARRRQALWAGAGAALTVGALVAVPNLLLDGEHRSAPVALPAASSSAAAGPAACQVRELPSPAGMTDVEADAVDPTGRYIVGHTTEKQNFHPVLWTDGTPRALPLTAKSVQATDVNSAGVVVGLTNDGGAEDQVFRYEDGVYTTLRMPPGKWHPYPTPVINTAGDVLINAEPAANIEGKGSIVLLWRAGSTDPVQLPLPKGANGRALADDGTIAGTVYRDGQAVAGYVWDQQGNGHKLRTPAGKTTAGYAIAGDWVTGGVWEPGNVALWNRRTGALTEIPAAERGGPGQAVNASGWVITDRGRLVRDGKVITLPGGAAGRIVRTGDLTDDGLVVGSVQQADETMRPRVWHC